MIQLLLGVIYLSFISLGLPDSLLGAAWPTMYPQFQVPVSYAGIISMIIAFGTILSSLQSDRLTRKLGTGKVTAISVAMTAIALFGFSVSSSFWMLCIWAIPYGLGAGSVDASLNNYVALHFASRHMSWLHCMWGVGASIGPYIMSFALTEQKSWNMGYRYISFIQIFLTIILILSLPLWKKQTAQTEAAKNSAAPLSLPQILSIPGAKEIMITFFCYCAMESTTGLWACSYLVLHNHLSAQAAAGFASLFYIGITVARGISGFLTMRFNDTQMIHIGEAIIALGIITLFLPFGKFTALAGLTLVGLGCAPIYPSVIHSTPDNFGADRSQAIIGVQMASAYVGTCLMPPFFGLLADHISISLFPVFLGVIFLFMFFMYQQMMKKTLLSLQKNQT